MNIKMWQSKS